MKRTSLCNKAVTSCFFDKIFGCGQAALCILLLASLAAAQDVVRSGHIADRGLKTSDFPRPVKLTDSVYIWQDMHTSGNGYTTNSFIVLTGDGVFVADGQGNAAATKKMVDFIATLTPQPIRYYVMCSEHGDHTGGNASFPANTTFISSPFSKNTMSRQQGARVPSETVADKKTLKMGNTAIEILFIGRSHTGGDLVVNLPAERILFLSETYSNRIFPSMRTAYPSEWIETLKKAEKMDARIFVPGHGFVDSPQVLKEELTNYRLALEAVVAEIRRIHKTGVSAEEGLKLANWGSYAAWTNRERNAAIAFARVYEELNGKLPK
jgi:glyoxylase-like metal-dependent hydrolase (beta-lactamase superfamily II)